MSEQNTGNEDKLLTPEQMDQIKKRVPRRDHPAGLSLRERDMWALLDHSAALQSEVERLTEALR